MHNAPLMRRLGAMLYDSLLVIALMFMATIPFIAVRGLFSRECASRAGR